MAGFRGLLELLGVVLAAPTTPVTSAEWLSTLAEEIRTRMADALPTATVVYDNAPVPATAAVWARVTIVFDTMTIATYGAPHWRATGSVVCSVYAARSKGDAVPVARCQDVIDAFRGLRIDDPYARFTSASFVGGTEFSDAWAGRTVRIQFAADAF